MHWTSRGDVSIIELIVYLPALILAVIVCSRHGFHRASGWIFTLILCIIRILGSGCQLATFHDQSSNLLEVTFIFELVGISPLLYATLGLISRTIDAVHPHGNPSTIYVLVARITQTIIALGLILSIVGGTSINIPSIPNAPAPTIPTTSKAGTLLYVLGFVILLLLTLTTLPKLPNAHNAPGEKRVLFAVILAEPLIATRLVYGVISTFSHDEVFSPFTGKVVVFGLLSVLMEFLVVVIYLVVGWFTDAPPVRQQGPSLVNRPWKGELFPGAGVQGGGGIRGGRSGRGGVIHMAVAAAREGRGNGRV